MGYSSNRKTPQTYSDINLYTDGCGDTYDKKYYVNGAYIDLCGLPIEEYMKNPCCCGSGNNSEESTTKPKNEIIVKSFEGEDGKFYFKAYSQYAVSSDIKIRVFYTDEVCVELDLYIGTTETSAEESENRQILRVELNIQEDDIYKYVAVSEEEQSTYVIYFKAVKSSEKNDVIKDFDVVNMKLGTASDIEYIIPATDFNYNELSEEEAELFWSSNQYAFALYLPKEIYDKKLYSIISNGMDLTNNFKYENAFTIDSKEYVLLSEKAEDGEDIAIFAPEYGEDQSFGYKLTLNKL